VFVVCSLFVVRLLFVVYCLSFAVLTVLAVFTVLNLPTVPTVLNVLHVLTVLHCTSLYSLCSLYSCTHCTHCTHCIHCTCTHYTLYSPYSPLIACCLLFVACGHLSLAALTALTILFCLNSPHICPYTGNEYYLEVTGIGCVMLLLVAGCCGYLLWRAVVAVAAGACCR
jgi:hypothetical protein